MRDSVTYLKDEVITVISDRKWAKILGLVACGRRGDPAWSNKNNALECVVACNEQEISIVVASSYMRPQDGEWSIRVENAKSGKSASKHGPYLFQPVSDATKIMQALVGALKLVI